MFSYQFVAHMLNIKENLSKNKKTGPKFDIDWLCPWPFNYNKYCTSSAICARLSLKA